MDRSRHATTRHGLAAWGWDAAWETAWETATAALAADGHVPARVVTADQGLWRVRTATGEHLVGGTGRLALEGAAIATARPTVGDWVALAPAVVGPGEIDAVLARRTAIVRRAPAARGATTQVLAANVDVVLIVTSLNRDFNLRRLERYLAVAWESGATPVVLLSKADLSDDTAGARAAAAAVAPEVEIVAVSVVSGDGLAEVRRHLGPGRTAVLVGSSGVGKSTLVNAIAGHVVQATARIREDDARGRHTTTGRNLLPLGDGLIIDTPGLRELGLADAEGLDRSFAEIAALAAACRFGDCAHEREPGCAVRAAIEAGDLPRQRLASYLRLRDEGRAAATRARTDGREAERRRSKAIHHAARARMRAKYGETP